MAAEYSAANVGPPARLRVLVRYGLRLRPEDLLDGVTGLLADPDPAIRREALGAAVALCGPGSAAARSRWSLGEPVGRKDVQNTTVCTVGLSPPSFTGANAGAPAQLLPFLFFLIPFRPC